MKLSGKRILLTGGGGFIGSHLAEKLVKEGAKVRVFLRYTSRGERGFLSDSGLEDRVEIIHGDLKDSDAVKKAMDKTDVVFHLAALIAIPYSYKHPLDVVETNVVGTLNVLNAAKEVGVEKIVHTSTSEVYGSALYVPIDEKHPLQGQSPYSASKIGADKLAESFHLSFGLPVATIRPFNCYGPRQSMRAVVPTIITQALKGIEVKAGSLHPTRDFTFVADTVDAFLRIAEDERSVGEVMNIGTGTGISVGELVKKIGELVGKELVVTEAKERVRPERSEVQRLVADSSKARELLGWEPKVSLDKGLKETIKWFSENMGRFRPWEYVV
ncbi:MAG: SDR family NAD(P)-dependent oxidoreductase [Candidatus Eisenbacteria bacterium]|nr:SDR family NAD(P)-dependent oxidoreductase [Candidatus Eisenbacteria bacterium]